MLSNSISTLLLSAVEGGIVAVIAIVTAIAGILDFLFSCLQ